jgi:hypothetical protein
MMEGRSGLAKWSLRGESGHAPGRQNKVMRGDIDSQYDGPTRSQRDIRLCAQTSGLDRHCPSGQTHT